LARNLTPSSIALVSDSLASAGVADELQMLKRDDPDVAVQVGVAVGLLVAVALGLAVRVGVAVGVGVGVAVLVGLAV